MSWAGPSDIFGLVAPLFGCIHRVGFLKGWAVYGGPLYFRRGQPIVGVGDLHGPSFFIFIPLVGLFTG